MSRIKMTSKPYRITKILKPTKARVFVDFKVGDVLQFSTDMRNHSGASGGGNYASDVTTHNITQGKSVVKYMAELINLLGRAYELEEVNE